MVNKTVSLPLQASSQRGNPEQVNRKSQLYLYSHNRESTGLMKTPNSGSREASWEETGNTLFDLQNSITPALHQMTSASIFPLNTIAIALSSCEKITHFSELSTYGNKEVGLEEKSTEQPNPGISSHFQCLGISCIRSVVTPQSKPHLKAPIP